MDLLLNTRPDAQLWDLPAPIFRLKSGKEWQTHFFLMPSKSA
jgi:hypothetical protein